MKQLKLFGMAIIITIMAAFGQQNAVASDWKTLEQDGYSIKYPDSFELVPGGPEEFKFMLLSKKLTRSNEIEESINLTTDDLSGINISLGDYGKLFEKKLNKMIDDLKIIESSIVKNKGQEFYRIVFTGKQELLSFKSEQRITTKNGIAYILTLTRDANQRNSQDNSGVEIMDSFEIK